MTRTERDSLGEKDLPDDVYYGIQTARAMDNFPVSGQRERPEFVRAYVMVKKAAALANMELGVLDPELGGAIVRSADEVLDGGLADHFTVDVFQAGAGTSFNMNVNEVLANRALEMLGRPKGDYDHLSPNDHVNMGQSSNDTFPTATHVAVAGAARDLIAAVRDLADAFGRKGEEYEDVPKSGRTHLMDATPLTLGQELRAYGSALHRAADRAEHRSRLQGPGGGETGRAGRGRISHIPRQLRSAPEPGGPRGILRVAQGACPRAHQDKQRPAPAGLRSDGGPERDTAASSAAGLIHHARQGQPGHGRVLGHGGIPGGGQRYHSGPGCPGRPGARRPSA